LKKYITDEMTFNGTKEGALWNNREGEWNQIERHDDEPVVMGEANMDSSSDSEEETPEDKKNHAEAIRRADSHVQIDSSIGKGKEKKR
jgi:hypothetical protein